MNYIIYKITNNINGKIYIGKHKTPDTNDGYMGSGKILNYAIEKYGETSFTKEILFDLDDEESMNNMERDLVDEEFVARLDTYNIMIGGSGGFSYVNENRLNVDHPNRENSIENLNNHEKSRETLNKLLEDPEYAREFKQKISNANRLYYSDHEHPWVGRKHLDETKRKIGEANSKHQKGEGNSQYGTMWVYNLELKQSKRISNDDPIPKGWIIGRKIKF